MSDIAERLRNRAHSHQAGCEICEAADEIDQLRFERDSARAELHETHAKIEAMQKTIDFYASELAKDTGDRRLKGLFGG